MYIAKTREREAVVPFWEYAPDNYFWVEVGAFYDRFGSVQITVLANPDPTVQALVRNTQIRKYIDLKRPDVAQFVEYLATTIPEVTEEVKTAVLALETTEEERFIKGLPQPIHAPPPPEIDPDDMPHEPATSEGEE